MNSKEYNENKEYSQKVKDLLKKTGLGIKDIEFLKANEDVKNAKDLYFTIENMLENGQLQIKENK